MKRLARLVHPEFRFGKTDIKDAVRLVTMGVGGFCFYWGTAEEIKKTISILRSRADYPLIFSADYENGLGQWMEDGTLLPSNMAIGASVTPFFARRKAEITAMEARAVGVDWIFAPVVDIASNPENPIVNIRSFGDDSSLVSLMASSYIDGLSSGGCLSCVKHFPGHGSTDSDSHLTLPKISKTAEELKELDMKPYRKLSGKTDAVMVGHLWVKYVDSDYPASFSKKIIGGLLRREVGFEGCVVTDALSMGAVEDEKRAAAHALLAGADILLVPGNPFALIASLNSLYRNGVFSDHLISSALKRQEKLALKVSRGNMYARDFSMVGCAEHRKFPEEIAASCITWAFQRKKFRLKKGDEVAYLEPLTPFGKIKGKAFVAAMRKIGFSVTPFRKGKSKKLIFGIFSNPRAYSGSINLSEEEKKHICKNLNLVKNAMMVSFGSPFVFRDFTDKISCGLCAFCALESFQKKSADIIGGLDEARGEMPVSA